MEVFRRKATSELYYKYELPDGDWKIFSKEQILRVSGFSHSGLLGYKPVSKNREAVALSLALEEYAARFFGDGAKPPVVLEHPNKLSPEATEKLRKAWNDMHRGLSNSQRVAILEEGMQLKPFGVTPEDSQAIESRSFQITEIARIFNMPPHMLKDLTRATYSNIEEQSLEFVIHTLRPWLVRFEQAYSIQLLEEKARRKYFFEHNIEGLLRGNIQTRYGAYATALGNGWINADEVRALENLNPQPKGQGEKYFVPLNWIPKEDSGKRLEMQPAKPPAPKEEKPEEVKGWWINKRETRSMQGRERIANQYYPLFKQAAQTIVNYESTRVKKAVAKSRTQRASIKESLEEIYRDVPGYIKDKLGPVIRSFSEAIQAESAAEMDVDVGISAELQEFIENYIDRYAERHTDSSLGQLISLLEEETEAIEQRIDEWRETRADKIAGDETVRNSNAVYQFMAFVVGFSVVWRVQSNKPCPFCSELNGQTIAQGGNFVKDGDELNPEGVETPMKIYGSKAHPPLHLGCKCALSII
jgi:HK97 family phage portal protein